MGSISEFFSGLPPAETLPKYIGELYLELHRGTLTTQARTKLLNRTLEQRLVECEVFATMAKSMGFAYPTETIQKAWQTLLLNQFHDILPGSSIHEVYKDTHRLLGDTLELVTEIRDAALSVIAGESASSDQLLVANGGLADEPLLAFLPGVSNSGIELSDGTPITTQPVVGGMLIGAPDQPVAGLGWRTLKIGTSSTEKPLLESPVHARPHDAGGVALSNDELRVLIAPDGTIAQIFDKHVHREVLTESGNQLVAYVDKPRAWDAWDIDETYERDAEPITAIDSITITESGPLRAAVRVERTFRSSRIVQTYRLMAGSRRLDIVTRIDWHERQVLLRTRFPLNIRTHEATYETMYGAFRRATHRNTSFEQARFEVGAQRWVDLSEPGYGVALLNNGKYGHAAHDNVVSMSLLRGPMYPDWLADEGEHRFTYAVYPHIGDWTGSNLLAEAQVLNSPLIVLPASAESVDHHGLVQISGVPLALGTLMPAHDGHGL
ncbi:MAG TPA: glycoside hydrolase family 38 C-terminal domain-containing protein, partial [Thermomicrobiales bacterium]|nr:glycoside hydrolase family 38 C-terminal domain-containing protein [Thermomicrobiales bacterium]